jgi:putative oxidoreductase
MNKKRIAKEIAAWLLALWLCYVFFRAGIDKFDDASGWSRAFRGWGFAVWFRVLIGVLEVIAALMLLVPRIVVYGTITIGVVMIGAAVTQLLHHRPHPAAYMMLVLATVLFVLRRKDRWRPGVFGVR